MKQYQLDCLVAEATGEDLDEIRRRGFSLADPIEVHFDPEPYGLTSAFVDWDKLQVRQMVAANSNQCCCKVHRRLVTSQDETFIR